jgi:phosphatidylglycerol:prolipoprotein diacylglycerol transferase
MYPILFKIGPLTIHTYGVLMALAFLAAIYVAAREGARLGLSAERFLDLGFFIILAGLVGSRLLFVILEPRTFLSHPLQIFAIWKGGLDFQGGLFLALVAVLLFIRHYKWPWRPTLDALALALPLGQFIGRIGCLMAGSCYGIPTKVPWAVTFTDPNSLCPYRVPVHPTQLYEGFLDLGVFLFLYWFRPRKLYNGQMALFYLFLGGLARFVVEFYRSPLDYRGPIFFGWMPLTQLIALGLFVIGGSLLLYNRFYRFQSNPQVHGQQ